MAERDLTPRLRTRMRGVERTVGLFVALAFLTLAVGFVYYIHHTAERKGWFLTSVKCHTFLQNAEGIKEGDPVRLFGFDAGNVTQVIPMPPFSQVGRVYVQFIIKGDNIGFIWDDSKVRITSTDFLGKRTLELIPGGTSGYTNLHASFLFEGRKVTGVWDRNYWDAGPLVREGKYLPYDRESKGYTLYAEESQALGERLDRLATLVEKNIPGVLALTNRIGQLLEQGISASREAGEAIALAKPSLSNLQAITSQLKNPKGSLGEWLLPEDIHLQAIQALTNANRTLIGAGSTLTNADVQLIRLTALLGESLEHLSGITGNLNLQVQNNTNLLKQLSETIVHADAFIQGLKKHWLLKSAFSSSSNGITPNRKLQPDPKSGQRR